MKKLSNIFILFLLLSSLIFVYAAEQSPELIVGADDKEKFDNAAQNIPINSDGSFNGSKFEPVKSKAELRIEAVNKWFEDNTPWLALVFGMTPALSWLFAVNILMLLFFLVLTLNLPKWKVRITGLIVFFVLLIYKVYVAISEGIQSVISYLWGITWIFGVLGVIGLFFLVGYIPRLVGKLFKKDKTKEILDKAKEKEEELEAEVKGIRGK